MENIRNNNSTSCKLAPKRGMSDKLRLIYKPFVLIAIGFILTYTFLHWLLFIKLEIPLKEEIISFLTFVLIWIPLLIWLRPRIKLLYFKNKNLYSVYLLLSCIAIAIPTIIAQEYLIIATGKLTQLDNISQISQHEKTKFYSLKNYHISKQPIAIYTTQKKTHTKGIGNGYYAMSLYIAMPILESNTDIKFETKYWLGKQYHESIRYSLFMELSDQERCEKYAEFVAQSLKEFQETDFEQFAYLEVLGNTLDRDKYNKALKQCGKNLTNDNIVFEAKTGSLEARKDKQHTCFFISLGIGFLAYFILLLFPKIQERKTIKDINA